MDGRRLAFKAGHLLRKALIAAKTYSIARRLLCRRAMVILSLQRLGRQIGSDHVDHDVYIAARGLGIGAGLMRSLDERLSHIALQARQADIETSL